jgi:hypothetical protein
VCARFPLRSPALVVSDRRQTKALSRARVVRDLSLDLRRSPRNMEGEGRGEVGGCRGSRGGYRCACGWGAGARSGAKMARQWRHAKAAPEMHRLQRTAARIGWTGKGGSATAGSGQWPTRAPECLSRKLL